MDKKAQEEMWRPRSGVITTEIIKQAIAKMIAEDVPGNIIDEEDGFEFNEITHLFLEHLDIVQIDHLWIMPALTVLKLSGNFIEKIENLTTLVNLVDLNLSFNKIHTIENLENLINIKRLSLYSNCITEIKNLEQLKNLKILTIGKNKIEEKECILRLRVHHLFSLNMADNPCAVEKGFRNYVAAHLPMLEYYEYKKVLEDERETGRLMHQNELDVLEREELESANALRLAESLAAKEEIYTQAFVEGLDQDQLYEIMMENDPSGQAILLIGDEVTEIFNRLKENIGKATDDIFHFGVEQHELRKKEIEMFNHGFQDAILKSRAKQRIIIEKFVENKSQMFLEVNDLWDVLAKQSSDGSMQNGTEEETVNKAIQLCFAVKKELISLELTLSEQLKEVFALFERNLGDMINLFIEAAQGFFTTMREHETVFSELLGDQVSRFLTQITIRNEELSTLPSTLRPIMLDKEAVNMAVASSHDIHLQYIDSREDQLMTRARSWYQKLCSDYELEETTRFRGRISEIVHFLELQVKDFLQYQVIIDDDVYVISDQEQITS